MYRTIIASCLLVVTIVPCIGSVSIQVKQSLSPVEVPRLTTWEQQRWDYYQGIVIGLTDRTVTILKDPRIAETVSFGSGTDKTPEGREYIRRRLSHWDQAPARTFRFDPKPIDPESPYYGAFPENVFGRGHRLSDVRLGDKVFLCLVPVEGYWDCYRIKITRRIAGAVPPADDAFLPEHRRQHIRCNARQFLESQAAPLVSMSLARSVSRLAQ